MYLTLENTHVGEITDGNNYRTPEMWEWHTELSNKDRHNLFTF